jgi:hypothetical protein
VQVTSSHASHRQSCKSRIVMQVANSHASHTRLCKTQTVMQVKNSHASHRQSCKSQTVMQATHGHAKHKQSCKSQIVMQVTDSHAGKQHSALIPPSIFNQLSASPSVNSQSLPTFKPPQVSHAFQLHTSQVLFWRCQSTNRSCKAIHFLSSMYFIILSLMYSVCSKPLTTFFTL